MIAGISCSGINNKEKQTTSSDTIVIVIPDARNINYDTIFGENGVQMITQGSPALSFYPGNYQEKITPVWNIAQDTLRFQIHSDWCIVKYRYNPISYHSFLLFNGDTAFIKHENGIPFLSVSGNNAKANDINFDYFKRLQYKLIDGYLLQDLYNHSYLTYYSIINNLSNETVTKKLKEDLISELKDEKNRLDSLKRNNLLSEQAFNYYNNRNHYYLLALELEDLSKEKMKEILLNYNDSLYNHDIFKFYNSYYFRVAQSYYTKMIKYNDFTVEDDYKEMYDRLNNDRLISGRLKNDLEWNWIHGIIRQQPVNIAKTYYEQIIKTLSDTVLTASLKNNYGELFNDSVMTSTKMELINQEGKIISFETIIDQNKGKVIYVDFWASWCAPCLEEMPNAEILRNKYADQNVTFVYLTLDDKKANWSSAIGKAHLEGIKDNYLILNLKTSPMIKSFQIASIPRYLLYDKEGKLVHAMAPGPGSKEVYELLDNYLTE
jgi:thiol-disulfide isomerase/thioredoxin